MPKGGIMVRWTRHDYEMKHSEEVRKRAKELREDFKKKYAQEKLEQAQLEKLKNEEDNNSEEKINLID